MPMWQQPIPKFIKEQGGTTPEDLTYVAMLPLGTYADGKYTGQAGGQASAEEVIWSLPNGLQAYAIFGAWAQRRVDAFTQIVRDPRLQRYVADKTNSNLTGTGRVGAVTLSGNLSVMVWFHGGGHVVGSNRAGVANFDGQYLLERFGVIVVTVESRLNVLGYMAHPALDGESPRSKTWGFVICYAQSRSQNGNPGLIQPSSCQTERKLKVKTNESGPEPPTVRRVSFLVAALSLAAATGLPAQVTQQWVAQFEGVLGTSVPVAIGIDTAGHMYVTGSSFGYSDGTSTYETVAYDSGGNQLWARDSGGVYDQASAIAVDQNSGNVYVTGMRRSFGFGGTYDYVTIAYDSSGNELWVAGYDGPDHLDDKPAAIAVDQLGNVYVTGSSDNGDGTGAYATVAYDGTGNQLWVSRYNGGSNGDGAAGIVVDQNGRTYVTGGLGSDYTTVAYDSGGNQLWVAHSPGFGGSRPKGIVINSFGNIVITARALFGGINCYGTVAYDVGGNQLWVSYYSGLGSANNEPSALAADGAGNVYVTGWVPVLV